MLFRNKVHDLFFQQCVQFSKMKHYPISTHPVTFKRRNTLDLQFDESRFSRYVILSDLLLIRVFSILYQIHSIRWISWIQLEGVNHDCRIVKVFLLITNTYNRVFTLSKCGRSDRNITPLLRIVTILNIEGKVYLIIPILVRLYLLHQIIETYNWVFRFWIRKVNEFK